MLENKLYREDKRRCGAMPAFQFWLRVAQSPTSGFTPPHLLKKLTFKICTLIQRFYCCEISPQAKIGPGLYIGHPFCITVNGAVTIGRNCNIHKGVTIGQQNRGPFAGAPMIGNNVWIGVGATVVGRIEVGDDVLIAPGAYVNRSVPSHSIAMGNPATIIPRSDATKGYINNQV